MATIHLAREGAKLGSFSEEEVYHGLRTRKFRPTDLAWCEGMPDWRPLSQVLPERPPQPTAAAAMSEATVAVPLIEGEPTATNAGLPWERRRELGFLKAFINTVSLVLTRPAEAFSLMKTGGDMTGPTLFALIGGSIGVSACDRLGHKSARHIWSRGHRRLWLHCVCSCGCPVRHIHLERNLASLFNPSRWR